MLRYAAIDIGTNSVLLLVAEKDAAGRFVPVVERAEITRLGRGVDKTHTLAPEAIEDTLRVVQTFAEEARALGAKDLAVCATSAARDATNGGVFLEAARQRANVEVEIISGEREAQLSYAATHADFGGQEPLVVIDIGGGSTEFIYGDGGEVTFRHSFDVGSVRLTERFGTDRPRVERLLADTFSALPPPPAHHRAVGVAGTVTTLYSILHAVEPYDAARVHGATLSLADVGLLADRLWSQSLEARKKLPGLQPKRADVIPCGALILQAALRALGASGCLVSDRGLRWGLLQERSGGTSYGREQSE
ncbi:MAG: Ppx/GppA family phosphatase [Myxococcota bacterium]